MKRFLDTFAALAVVALLLLADARLASAGEQKASELNVQVPVQLKYFLYLPENYDQQEKWPLVLFLHGAGERGDDLNTIKKHGLPKLIAAGKQYPFICVSPQCPRDRWWDPFVLTALLDDIESRYKVDHDRIIVTGLSMGGFGTWTLASATPNRFAAIVPICGGGDLQRVKYISHIPTWIFHGEKDPAVPVERSREMAAALEKAGAHPKLTIYPEALHDSWTETYDNSELYEWMLAQRRVDPPPMPKRK